ncbi:MAG TPA: hypothetical protein VMV52_04255 [Candidatus Nanopelagicaceae bacterium]|nr:hypothetical protein [Candidatus Nanopelagicaceae bacterium]
MALIALGGRQAIEFELLEYPPDSRVGDGEIVIALQIHRNLLWTKVVVLAQVDDLSHHLRAGGVRRVLRRPGALTQPLRAFGLKTTLPFIKSGAADAVVATGRRYVHRDFIGVAKDG